MKRLRLRHPGDLADAQNETQVLDDDRTLVPDAESTAADDDCVAGESTSAVDTSDDTAFPEPRRSHVRWPALAVYVALPVLALLLTVAAAFLKWQDASARDAQAAAHESTTAAADGAAALLSYRPDTVQHDLEAAKNRLTGNFLEEYTKLTHDVVIPGAQQKQISAVATVAAAAPTSATADHAVVLLFIDQTTTIGTGTPSNTASTIRVTVDKIDNRWLISQFEPV